MVQHAAVSSLLVSYALTLQLRAQTIQECRYRLIKVSQILANLCIMCLKDIYKQVLNQLRDRHSAYGCVIGTGEEVIISMHFCVAIARRIHNYGNAKCVHNIVRKVQNYRYIKARRQSYSTVLQSKQFPHLRNCASQ